MSISDMRYLIKKTYKSEHWKRKVDNMPDEQVIAIYWDFVKRGKFKPKEKTVKKPKEVTVEQLTIFDMVKPTVRNYKVIAVDFDGTLCEDKWPEIGAPNRFIITQLIKLQEKGARLILWTCRNGKLLEDAIKWCKERGLIFDAVNENLPEILEAYGGKDSRKITADYYIDDKALNPLYHALEQLEV